MVRCSASAGCVAINVGCSPDARFHLNAVYIAKQERDSKAEIPPERRQEIATALIGMFGTPDDPQVPSLGELDINSVVDIQKLHGQRRAGGQRRIGARSGPVSRALCPLPRSHGRRSRSDGRVFESLSARLPPGQSSSSNRLPRACGRRTTTCGGSWSTAFRERRCRRSSCCRTTKSMP